jgi:ribosomal-protein-alanine N-acetyltransferase
MRPQVSGSSCGFFVSEGELVSFRAMSSADLDEVMLIERASFPFPWSTRFFLQELQAQYARSIVAEIGDRIVGYVIFWLLPDDVVDIHNVAVHGNFRRRGIGRCLLEQVIAEARRRKSIRVTLEVRRSNAGAQRLYESAGFIKTGIRQGYYSDDGEDALTMTLDLTTKNM